MKSGVPQWAWVLTDVLLLIDAIILFAGALKLLC